MHHMTLTISLILTHTLEFELRQIHQTCISALCNKEKPQKETNFITIFAENEK